MLYVDSDLLNYDAGTTSFFVWKKGVYQLAK